MIYLFSNLFYIYYYFFVVVCVSERCPSATPKVVKTRLQLQGELQQRVARDKRTYRGVWHAFRTIVATEGPFAIQKGTFLPPADVAKTQGFRHRVDASSRGDGAAQRVRPDPDRLVLS